MYYLLKLISSMPFHRVKKSGKEKPSRIYRESYNTRDNLLRITLTTKWTTRMEEISQYQQHLIIMHPL